MVRLCLVLIFVVLGLNGCSTTAQSNPARTATEQLLVSTAAEHAANKLALLLPPNSAAFMDNTNFEGTDSKYAIATIRTSLLKQGIRFVDDKKTADVIIETRSGVLSTDRNTFLVGIPSFNIPIPFASVPLPFPQIALWGEAEQKGVAKFAITSYDAKKGTLVSAQDPQYGFSHRTEKTLLIFISWVDSNALPANIDASDDENKDMAEPQKPHPEFPEPQK
jgi:hypothetical protein